MNIDEIEEGVWFEGPESCPFYFFEKPKNDGTQIVEIGDHRSFLYIPFLSLEQAIAALKHIHSESDQQKNLSLDVKGGGTFFIEYCAEKEEKTASTLNALQIGYLDKEFQAGFGFTNAKELREFAVLTRTVLDYFEKENS